MFFLENDYYLLFQCWNEPIMDWDPTMWTAIPGQIDIGKQVLLPERLTQGTNSETWTYLINCATSKEQTVFHLAIPHNPGKKTQLHGHISQHLNQRLGSSQTAEREYSINVMELINVILEMTHTEKEFRCQIFLIFSVFAKYKKPKHAPSR